MADNPQEPPDHQLVSAALTGHTDSFIALCKRYYPAMLSVTRAILHDDHLCEDATQEAFAKAARNLHTLKNPNRFGPWLTAICRNEAKSILRKTPPTLSLSDNDPPQITSEENPDINATRLAIQNLPDETRELIYLKYRNALSYQAIAQLLNTTPQAVHGKLQRAKKSIKESVTLDRNRRLS